MKFDMFLEKMDIKKKNSKEKFINDFLKYLYESRNIDYDTFCLEGEEREKLIKNMISNEELVEEYKEYKTSLLEEMWNNNTFFDESKKYTY